MFISRVFPENLRLLIFCEITKILILLVMIVSQKSDVLFVAKSDRVVKLSRHLRSPPDDRFRCYSRSVKYRWSFVRLLPRGCNWDTDHATIRKGGIRFIDNLKERFSKADQEDAPLAGEQQCHSWMYIRISFLRVQLRLSLTYFANRTSERFVATWITWKFYWTMICPERQLLQINECTKTISSCEAERSLLTLQTKN